MFSENIFQHHTQGIDVPEITISHFLCCSLLLTCIYQIGKQIKILFEED